MNKLFRNTAYLFIIMSVSCHRQAESTNTKSDIYEGIEFEMPLVIEPSFPNNSVSIKDYGAIPDGQTLNSKAIADAIDAVSAMGGGKVVFPRGIWLTGPIILKSNINIHAEAGALVLFSTNKDLYPLIESSYEGLESVRCLSPISGKDLKNIAITGEGIFDGSGDAWRHVKRFKMTNTQWEKLLASGGTLNDKGDIWYPSEGAMKGAQLDMPITSNNIEDYSETKDSRRPVMVSLVRCKNILLDGPVFQNSPAWNIHPLMCENLTIRNIDVRNPWYSQNGDGLDIESCKNSLVYNCTFDVGDDAICIKSGKDKAGRDRGMPTENTIIKNCVVYHGHGGVTVGSEMSGGVKNLHASNCTFIGTDVGLRFKSTRGRGGVVEKIYISNIDMVNIPTNAISFNLYYGGLSVSEMLAKGDNETKIRELIDVTEATPQFKDISIKNITCKGAYQAIYLQGLPEMNLENVSMENLKMEAENGLLCMDARDIHIKNLTLKTTNYPALIFHNTNNAKIDGLEMPDVDQTLISVTGSETANINIKSNSTALKEKSIFIGENVDAGAVHINK